MRITFPCAGRETAGYLAVPAAGPGPGILVFQEWWGLVPHIERMCDRLAEVGFTALAPDLYSGRTTTNPDEAGRLMMALDVPQVALDVGSAIDFLRHHESCASPRVGVTGFCLGGQVALYAACLHPQNVAACVDFYGIHPNLKPDVSRMRGPFLGVFAEHDEWVNGEVVADLAARLAKAGRHFEIKTYEGVHHAFMNDTRPDVYDADAAHDAWNRMADFFRAHVK